MCDYCGCRTRPLLARLGIDHARIQGLSTAIRHDMGVDTALATLAELLAAHSATEEAGLYPELAAAGIATDDLYADHAAVDALVAAARAGDAAALTELEGALARLDAHIQREEYDLFPAAHQLLSDAAWDRIDAGDHEHLPGHDHPHPH